MKRVFAILVFGLGGVALLGGCPIYPDRQHRVCLVDDGCYSCPDPWYSSHCFVYRCASNLSCPAGYACASDGTCRPGASSTAPTGGASCAKPTDCPAGQVCGGDNRCHSGDCNTFGCPSAYVCKLAGGALSCVAREPATSQCKSDAECATSTGPGGGAGSKCLSGVCTLPADQCIDGTQCAGAQQCVQGVCTPQCSATKACPTGFSCDLAKGVCTGNPTPCKASSQCASGLTCVGERCVDPCGAGGTCAAGLVCVDGGCIPDQRPQFVCATEGVQDKCSSGSMCIRHSCYVTCDPTKSDSCNKADKFNQCKSVVSNNKTFNVCGSDTNLGGDCDPSRACSNSLVCIDGYCR